MFWLRALLIARFVGFLIPFLYTTIWFMDKIDKANWQEGHLDFINSPQVNLVVTTVNWHTFLVVCIGVSLFAHISLVIDNRFIDID